MRNAKRETDWRWRVSGTAFITLMARLLYQQLSCRTCRIRSPQHRQRIKLVFRQKEDVHKVGPSPWASCCECASSGLPEFARRVNKTSQTRSGSHRLIRGLTEQQFSRHFTADILSGKHKQTEVTGCIKRDWSDGKEGGRGVVPANSGLPEAVVARVVLQQSAASASGIRSTLLVT